MGQAKPLRPIALVVEDDELQRGLVATLLEETGMTVLECETAEQAEEVVKGLGAALTLLYTDIKLAGQKDGVELARTVKAYCPGAEIIASSGSFREGLPRGSVFLPKPWPPLVLLMHAERCLA